jgi:hypothetical protein
MKLCMVFGYSMRMIGLPGAGKALLALHTWRPAPHERQSLDIQMPDQVKAVNDQAVLYSTLRKESTLHWPLSVSIECLQSHKGSA